MGFADLNCTPSLMCVNDYVSLTFGPLTLIDRSNVPI